MSALNHGTTAVPSHALQQALQALALPLSLEAQHRLLAYQSLLQRWNRVYNLTALRDAERMLSLHLVDCLAVLPALRTHADGMDLRVLDVGSGGGLPGVVLAITQPQWQVTCVDAVAKKASFLRQVGAELALSNLAAVHARIESVPVPPTGAFDLITSRAFASLADFVTLTRHLLDAQGVWVAMKGKRPDDEIAQLPADVEVFHVEHIRVPGVDAQRCLVWLRPVRRRSP